MNSIDPLAWERHNCGGPDMLQAQTSTIERRQRQFAATTGKLKTRITRTAEAAVRDAKKALDDFLVQLNAVWIQRGALAPTVFQAATIEVMREAAQEEILRLEQILVNQFGQRATSVRLLAEQAIIEPFTAIGGNIGPMITALSKVQGIGTEFVEFQKGFSATMIQARTGGLAANIQRDVNFWLSRGSLGIIDIPETISSINQALTGPAGEFKYSFQAERIFRTETLRVASFVDQAGGEAVNEVVPMQKQWQWSGISRVTHAAADGQTVGMKEKFHVGGESLLMPRDPAASAANVINCGCSVIHIPDLEALERLEQDVMPVLVI